METYFKILTFDKVIGLCITAIGVVIVLIIGLWLLIQSFIDNHKRR